MQGQTVAKQSVGLVASLVVWVTAPLLAHGQEPPAGEAAPTATTTATVEVARPAAGPNPKARARYDLGLAAFRARLFVEAGDHFAAAYALEPAPTLLFNLARALEEQGEAGKAAERFDEYLARYPNAEDAEDVRRRLSALRAVARGNAPGRLSVSDLPPDATVFVDDRPLPMAEAPRWSLAKGEHAVRIERPGYAPLRVTVQIRSNGDAAVAWVATQPLAVEAPPPVPEKPFPLKRVVGWSLLGVGLAATGVGIYMAGEAGDTLDEFNAVTDQVQGQRISPAIKALRDERETLRGRHEDQRTLTYAMWGLGGALVAGGVTLVLLDAFSDDPPETEGRISVGVAPGWLGLSGTF